MANKSILAIVIMILLGSSFIIYIPLLIISIDFSPYVKVKGAPEPQEYRISNTSGIHKLNLNVDVGNIEITYTYDPVDYHAKIEVITEMIGQNLNSKNFNDYFNVIWDDKNTYTIELVSESWFDNSLWIDRNVSIIVTLNANILFDINTTINIQGDIELYVPGEVSINNVAVNIYSGTALLVFNWCTIEGNITVLANNGDITLRTNNVHYTRSSVLNITNISGTTIFDIFQSKEMGVNIITAMGETISGITSIVYRDTTPKIGAKITFNNFSGEWGPFDFWDGFHLESLEYRGYIFTSFDFPTENNYIFLLFKELRGSYSVNLNSVPN